MNEALPFFILGLLLAAGWLIALIGMLTARYPAGPGRGIFGDACGRLAAALLVDDGRWTARCERAGWEPGDEGEVGT